MNFKKLSWLIAFILFSLQGCLPHSLTKFEEDPPNIQQAVVVVSPDLFSYLAGTNFLVVDSAVSISATFSTEEAATFSASPALPTGLTIDNATGDIIGTPTVISATTAYTITATTSSGGVLAAIVTIASQEIPAGLTYKPLSNGSVTTVVLTLASFTIGIAQFETALNPGNDIVTEAGQHGTITFVDTASNKVFVSVDDANQFQVGDLIDNLAIYSFPEAQVSNVDIIFATSANGILIPTLTTGGSAANELRYSVIPNLPTGFDIDDGANNAIRDCDTALFQTEAPLGLSATFGAICGNSAITIDVASYTVFAINDVGSTSTVVNFGVSEAPLNLSYNQNVAVTLLDVSNFTVGDIVSTSFTIPLAEGATGLVREIDVTGNTLLIEIFSGEFVVAEGVDNVKTFAAAESLIQTVNYYNVKVTFNADPGIAVGGDIQVVALTDEGVVGYKSVDSVLDYYIQLTKGDFAEGDVEVNSGQIMDQIYSRNAVLTLVDSSAFIAGEYVATSTAATAGEADSVGIIHSNNGATEELFVQVEDAAFDFGTSANIDDFNPFTATATTITGVKNEYAFYAYQNEPFIVQPQKTAGNNLNYSIAPDLPAGITLDDSTGVISGSPTEPSAKAVYVMTATNSIGSVATTFNLRVHNNFQLFTNTANTTSAILHKEGRNFGRSNCTVTQDQVNSGANKDIVCIMDVGELDLYFNGLETTIKSGAGLCEYIETAPYFFYDYEVQTTAGNRTVHNFDATCDDCGGGAGSCAALVSDSLTCNGDYSGRSPAGPNCDTGTYDLTTITYRDEDGDTICTNIDTPESVTTAFTTVNCGGKAANCIAGAATDELSTSQLEGFFFSTIDATPTGADQSWNFTSPISNGFISNRHVANYSKDNTCGGLLAADTYNYNVTNWELFTGNPGTPGTGPFTGSNPFYKINCLNPSFDTIASIRVLVREWDLPFEIRNALTEDIDSHFIAADAIQDAAAADNQRNDWDNSGFVIGAGDCAAGAPTLGTDYSFPELGL